MKSKCCNAEMRVENNGGTTCFYVCKECQRPCDIKEGEEG